MSGTDSPREPLFAPSRILVDSWPPEYGAAFQPDEDLDELVSDLAAEVRAEDWTPLQPPEDTISPDHLAFVDGVMRTDARLSLVAPGGNDTFVGLAASFGAGILTVTNGTAEYGTVEIRRGLFARAHSVTLDCGRGVIYEPFAASAPTDPDRLYSDVTQQMRALEGEVANALPQGCVAIVDGPLSAGRRAPLTLGYVKTHHRHHLPESHHAVVVALKPGQRTPMWGTSTNYSEFSWYLRLPGATDNDPWGGIVRLESPPGLGLERARDLADATARLLPGFASKPHRDPRAPQNLVPIGALERRLRHLLGDQSVLSRMLRRTCSDWHPDQD